MHGFLRTSSLRELLALVLLVVSSPIWAQRVAGPPSLQQLQPQDSEPIEDDPAGRRIWMRERFSGDSVGQKANPLDYKDMMLRETQRQNELYPQLAPGALLRKHGASAGCGSPPGARAGHAALSRPRFSIHGSPLPVRFRCWHRGRPAGNSPSRDRPGGCLGPLGGECCVEPVGAGPHRVRVTLVAALCFNHLEPRKLTKHRQTN